MEDKGKSKINDDTAGPSKPPDERAVAKNGVILEERPLIRLCKPGHQPLRLPTKNTKSHQHASKPNPNKINTNRDLPSLLDIKINNVRELKAHTQQLHKSLNGKIKTKRVLTIGFKKLEEWSNKEPHHLMFELVHQMKQFEELLESNMSEDMIVLILKVLAKLCSSPFKENKTEIMNLASKEKFIARLQNYIVVRLPFLEPPERKNNALFWDDVDGFFENLIVVFESLIQSIPTKACEVLPKIIKSIIRTIPILETEQNLTVSVDTKQKLEKLQEKSELCKIELEKVKREKGDYELEPPDDFRQMNVYPTAGEIMTSERTFVRRHRIKGSYENVDQYLDVQFRLLREDFIAPLRKGIHEYRSRNSKPAKRISNIRVYPHVEFLSPRYSNGQTGVLVQFEKSPINFKLYKRLMYGALVCFTNDDFSTLLFGKIIERDEALLRQGKVVVSFQSDYNNYKLNAPYLMIEYSVYFEPYYHVLKALQNIQEDKFPLKDYFIDVKTEIELPDYLNGNSIYKIKDFSVNLSDTSSWPSAIELGLDNTQYAAFKAALTQKFVVIQGPPGTGKTYLGLQIAKTLIQNDSVRYTRTPILVVCYTNHALDQFLEGLTDTTTRIVRVGGQSKNEELEKFNLVNRRKASRHRFRNAVLNDLHKQVCDELRTIKDISETIDEIPKFKGIINFKHFATIDHNLRRSWFATASSDEIIQWLLCDAHNYFTKERETHQVPLEEEMNAEEGEASNSVVEKELDKLLEDEARNAHGFNEFEYFAELVSSKSDQVTYMVTTSKLKKHINEILDKLKGLDQASDNETDEKWVLEHQATILQVTLDYLQMRLDEGKSMKVRSKPANIDLKHPENIPANSRWKLYFYWLQKYQESLVQEMVNLENKYRRTYNQYNEMRNIEDAEIMKQMTVVGMTTTGAARLQSVLQALQCRIVIVEEAAEVLESHIVVSLTEHCEHLILIGDHQQLRPSTADYKMEKDYNLGISLFERMVLNNVQCHVLGVQHRMRPEIAKLIVPNVYPKLDNHSSVYNFPRVLGIDANLYFIDHRYPEKESGDSSKKNMHEATFLIRLACYLVQNGYEPKDVTIIAAYSGQMFALWEVRKQYESLSSVRITVLDNYQGEESRIILLSLVRNNEDNKIGFLKIENRVCVALSRAKEGFYMMGNIELLSQNSEIWPKVKATLESQQALGRSLLLRCEIHPAELMRVEVAEDFDKVPRGGCNKMCDGLLKCGHTCPKICHVEDKEHINTECSVICSKILCENNHQCEKRCYEDCGECKFPMERTLQCFHTQMVPCYLDLSEYKCQIPVEVDLPCGHKQKISCSADVSAYQCTVPVEASLPCGHKVQDKPCFKNIETYPCPFPCDTRVESCGHTCSKQCHVKDDPDHLHYYCYKPCLKAYVDCSMPDGEKHPCTKWCFEQCPPCPVIVKKSQKSLCTLFNCCLLYRC
ncbi:hypothetical protein ILUMI_03225 [Ignelater luminosus]|uniref:NF-X1-type domain-containing protein n=1 Tax=Ignelater luminosus TaxID=2038154 RepID=A0A8K0GKN1_IGNLU|nr:hypothetical protein ILUMI_03225 [Ignelater luminosus]